MPEASSAKAQVLASIRAAKPKPSNSDIESAWQAIQRDYKVAAELSQDQLLHLLEDRLIDYDANVFRCEPHQVAKSISHALRQRGKQSIVIPSDLPSEWLPNEVHFIPDHTLTPEQLDQTDGVLTAATLAIADTGTIVLQNTTSQGRRAITLVPDYHLCVLYASQVVQSVPQAMRLLEATASLPTTMFSGPSATADIEMTRIKGVHGPRFLDVILVLDDSKEREDPEEFRPHQ